MTQYAWIVSLFLLVLIPHCHSFAPEKLIDSQASAKFSSRADSGRAFLAYLSTSTYRSVTVTTTTAFYTCISAATSTSCTGRRRRRRTAAKTGQQPADVDDLSPAQMALMSSIREEEQLNVQSLSGWEEKARALAGDGEGGVGRDGRAPLLQVTSTTTTTMTLTSTSTNSLTTVSLSMLCNDPLDLFPTCG